MNAASARMLRRCVLAASVLCISSAWAMPPSPELLERMQRGEAARSYYFEHEADIRALGIDSPTKVQLLCDLAAQHLDQDFNVLAILVDFSDHVASAQPSFFDNLLYGNGAGTVKSYYSEVTYGNVTLVTLDMPSALGWKRAPQTYSYYVNNQQGFGAYPQNAQKLAEDAVALANPFVNFANYDNDGDGYVDALFVIHSGPGAEFTGSNGDIWSHKWGTHSPQLVDGVYAYTYSMEPEYWQTPGDMTCGVYAHEMGHAAFGLPDLYDTGYDSKGLGKWSLMAGGSWNGSLGNSPAHPDAWCLTQMGAAQAVNVTVNRSAAAIPSIETTPAIYRLWTNGATGSQYYLVENRQRTGYDTGLPASGLLIYHIDETQSSNDNQWYPGHTSSGHYLVALEQADNAWSLEQNVNQGNTGDPYPGSASNSVFDDASAPNSRSYSGSSTNVAVRNISASGATMTADLIINNTPVLVPPTVVVQCDSNGFVRLDWAATGAPYYKIYSASTVSGPFSTLEATTSAPAYVDSNAAAQFKFYEVSSSTTP